MTGHDWAAIAILIALTTWGAISERRSRRRITPDTTTTPEEQP